MHSKKRCFAWTATWLFAAAAIVATALAEPAAPLFAPPNTGALDAAAISEPWSPPAAAAEPLPSAGTDEPLPSISADDQDANIDLMVDGVVVDEEPGWYQPTYWFGPSPWDTGIELGVNGSSGNNESLSIQSGGYIKRESRFSKLDLDVTYNRTTSGGLETQNNAQFDVRNDWLLDDKSPWTLFGQGNVFYDEFQAFDLQTNANTGIGYRFVHRPDLDLMGRFGGGASREFGGPDDRWVPESLFGFEYNQHLSATQKFYGKLDYYPEWEKFGEFRLVADAGWEVELVQPENLSLKISATDRYDSTPNGVNPHLVNYSVLLLLKL